MTHMQATSDTVAGDPITLMVNGAPRDLSPGSTLGTLLAELELDPRMIVVELNRVIMRDRAVFAATELRHGDTVELVHFVGGG